VTASSLRRPVRVQERDGGASTGPRVLFSHDIFGFQRYGGVSRYVVHLHSSLVAAGVDSRVFGGLHVNRYLDGVGAVTGRRIEPPSPRPLRGAVWLMNVGAERQVVNTWKPAAYHLTYYSRRRPRLRTPVVVTVYDMIHELFPQQFPANDHTSEHKRWWVNAASLVFVPSERTRSDLVQLWPTCAAKVVILRPGLLPRNPSPASSEPSGYGDYLLFVGDRRPPYKNFLRLAEAIAQAEHGRDCQLVCFGGGELSDDERRHLGALGVLDRTHTVSGSDALLDSLYRHAAALVYPSIYEGFGFPLIEAMTVGCPVVCSQAGPLPEVVGAAAVMFDPVDVDSMAAAIDRVLGDAELARTLRHAGAVRAQAFDWRLAGREARAYYELLGQ
jgi:glycosyltransferase involved in cell wall biosynthesis